MSPPHEQRVTTLFSSLVSALPLSRIYYFKHMFLNTCDPFPKKSLAVTILIISNRFRCREAYYIHNTYFHHMAMWCIYSKFSYSCYKILMLFLYTNSIKQCECPLKIKIWRRRANTTYIRSGYACFISKNIICICKM